MQQTLFLILATSMWTVGLYLATGKGQILHGLSDMIERVAGPTLNYPILGCPYCMPSVHGFLICQIFHAFYGFTIAWYWYYLQWIFIVPCSSALNYIIYNLIRILKAYGDAYAAPEKSDEEINTTNTVI
jgi:hypothetical protein